MTSAELIVKQGEIEARLETLRARRAELKRQLKAIGGSDAEAIALLDEVPGVDPAAIHTELVQSAREIATAEKAANILLERLQDARAVEHEARVEAAIPKHRETVRRVLEAALTLARAISEESAVRESVGTVKRRYSDRLRPMVVAGIGGSLNYLDRNSNLCNFIREGVQFNFLTGNESFLQGVNWK